MDAEKNRRQTRRYNFSSPRASNHQTSDARIGPPTRAPTSHANSNTEWALYKVTQTIEIVADPKLVWDALIDVSTSATWRNGNFKTIWSLGEHFEITATIGTKEFSSKGIVRVVDPPSVLEYAYWSPIQRLPDIPESYSTVRMTVDNRGKGTFLTVEHWVPPSPVMRGEGWEIGPESGQKHVEFYWRMTLPILKRIVEHEG